MKKTLAVLAIVATLALTGCGTFETSQEEALRLGIECKAAGGEWKLVNPDAQYDSFKDKQFCEFTEKP